MPPSPGEHHTRRRGKQGVDPRCDGASLLRDPRISRVHAVVLRDEDDLPCLLDVGSSNGTWCGQRQRRMVPLEPGQRCSLGSALVQWEPAQ